MRVLVVAAGMMAQAGMAALVESVPGAEVAAAVSPGDAASVAADLDPDICLVDLEGTSLDLQSHFDVITELAGEGSRPVLVVGETEDVVAIAGAGAAGVVSPSVPADALGAALEAALSGLGVVYPAAALVPRRPEPSEQLERPYAPPLEPLTPRELEILRLISDGLTNQQMARRLSISEHTAKFHVSAVLGKLGAQSRAEAVTIAYRNGLISI